MFERIFLRHADACEFLNCEAETLRQVMMQEGLPAYLHLRSTIASFLDLSFIFGSGGGVAPHSGRNSVCKWQCATKPFKDAYRDYYLLTGWFRIEPDCLADAVLAGSFPAAPQLVPPSECDGCNDGDVWELSLEALREYEGATWIEIECTYGPPELKDLWYRIDDLRRLGHKIAFGQEPVRGISAYPQELRAAIEAFEAVSADPRAFAGKSPRAAILEWLAANKPEIGSNARERIATVANWQPAGGAPKTPGS